MGLFNRYKLGSRVLRLGKRGPDVNTLQAMLRERGYDIGVEEDYFGYLTQDALQQFQRDFGLVGDGVAGPKVYALLLQARLPINRRVHVVQSEETIEKIAATYGVGIAAFAESNKIRALYPGQRLVFFDREVWGIATPGSVPDRELTGILYNVETAEAPTPRNPCPAVPVCVPMITIAAEEPELCIHNRVRTYRRRKRTAQDVLALAEGESGICFSWTHISRVDGGRYLSLLRRIRRRLDPDKRLFVELARTVPKWNLLGGVDYGVLNRIADRVVIGLTIPTESAPYLGKEYVEQLLWPVLRQISSWKILLKIPVYAVQWNVSDPDAGREILGYSEAMNRVFRRNARVQQDSDGRSYYRYYQGGSEYHLRIAHREVLNQVMATINRHNLAGVVLDCLGMEDPRLMNLLRSHFRTAQF